MALINVSICLTDIPKERITLGKNKKKYLNICIGDRREVDKYGNDKTVYISQSKEEREAQIDKIYLGGGKTFDNFQSKPAAPREDLKYQDPVARNNYPEPEITDDLPF